MTPEEQAALGRVREWLSGTGGIRDCVSWSDCKTLMQLALREHHHDEQPEEVATTCRQAAVAKQQAEVMKVRASVLNELQEIADSLE